MTLYEVEPSPHTKADRTEEAALEDLPPGINSYPVSRQLHTHQLPLCSVLFKSKSQHIILLKKFQYVSLKGNERILFKLNCRSVCEHFKDDFFFLKYKGSAMFLGSDL